VLESLSVDFKGASDYGYSIYVSFRTRDETGKTLTDAPAAPRSSTLSAGTLAAE
jgi:hypothetical protein